ncbi:unnamed protein product [Oikopleura dioica]|uniref:Glucosylceramidase n=1 Tax=Oikopleura dioica TaxID=34765 RepID=E4YUZ1_OIKDI|nr:unnamed protein product [Oikopleura dioica]
MKIGLARAFYITQSVVLALNCDPVFLLASDSPLCRCSSHSCDDLVVKKPPDDFDDDIDERSIFRTGVRWNAPQQIVRGFGGALTDATLLQYANFSSDLQTELLNGWFSSKGSEFALVRLPIGGTDFSTHAYTLNDDGPDFDLENFRLSEIDLQWRIPVINAAKDVSPHNIGYFASMWSPPVWLKTNGDFNGIGKLRGSPGDIYHQTLARYYRKYVDEMKENGVSIIAITSQNEPTMGLFINSEWNALGWSPKTLRDWLELDLIPEFRNSSTKIWLFDDNRIILRQYINYLMSSESVRHETTGIALHWYWDKIVPASISQNVHKEFPDHELIASEACTSRGVAGRELALSWKHGEDYSLDIIQNFKIGFTAWVDWNLALDMSGGPNWARNHRNAPTLVDVDKNEFYRLPMFYHLAHFSKFFTPGTQIIPSDSSSALFGKRPDGYFTAVALNSLEISTDLDRVI